MTSLDESAARRATRLEGARIAHRGNLACAGHTRGAQEGRSLTTPHRSPLVGRTLSLERKLPLLMTAVLVAVLALSLFLTYSTLTRSAESTARDRLISAARQVAGTVQAATQQRLTQLREVAGDSAVVRALRGAAAGAADTVGVVRALARVRSRSDSA